VIRAEAETAGSGGRHQSVIRRTRHDAYDPPPTVADSSLRQQQRLTTAYDAGREPGVDDVRRQTAATSTIRDYHHGRFRAEEAVPTPAGGACSSFYYASRLEHAASAAAASPTDDDDDDAVEDYAAAAQRQQLPGATGARQYFRVGCAAAGQQQQQQRLQHHVPTGNHVTGYTSVIVDTQQLHANGYVH